MFVRRKRNKSGSISIQIISKKNGRYKVVKTVGCATEQRQIEQLVQKAKQEIKELELQGQIELFPATEKDLSIQEVFNSLKNSSIRTVGPELIFGKIYDYIGLNAIKEELFRHLVISRLAYPLSKLKTVEYLRRYQGIEIEISSIYRFLDKLNSKLKQQVEQIIFNHTKQVLGGSIDIVFYDMTTLYFEASDEDDLRKTGFSKDGKHSHPQIFIGLLVGLGGYPIAYDIFEGNIYEGHTLIPFLEKISKNFNLKRPIVVADSGLLSKKNIDILEQSGYQYILGARLKNESDAVKRQILELNLKEAEVKSIKKEGGKRLVISYSKKRAKKDAYNRERGLKRLEKRLSSGKLTKSNINNRGYNKYLIMKGDVEIEIDYHKYKDDSKWDGLKGYITNAQLTDSKIIENYKHLWQIEKAFRMSKTDLRIRPIYHRLKQRIEAHICISFVAYAIYKELERALIFNKSTISVKEASELTHNMYQITYRLPDAKTEQVQLLEMDKKQSELYEIVNKFFRVSH